MYSGQLGGERRWPWLRYVQQLRAVVVAEKVTRETTVVALGVVNETASPVLAADARSVMCVCFYLNLVLSPSLNYAWVQKSSVPTEVTLGRTTKGLCVR